MSLISNTSNLKHLIVVLNESPGLLFTVLVVVALARGDQLAAAKCAVHGFVDGLARILCEEIAVNCVDILRHVARAREDGRVHVNIACHLLLRRRRVTLHAERLHHALPGLRGRTAVQQLALKIKV